MQTENLPKIRMIRRLGAVLRSVQMIKLEWQFGSVFYFTRNTMSGGLTANPIRFVPIQSFLFLPQDSPIQMQFLSEHQIKMMLSRITILSDCRP